MAFEKPKTRWQTIKEIIIGAVLISALIDLFLLGAYLAERI